VVRKSVPGATDFVPHGLAGRSYVSPGYVSSFGEVS
jgi:hypothetical protein